ncbi:uncharacterized protein [Amphiura filiformis]|uniref:uncharacterized protein isoform X2 n=1 Tax=Amphiura filiformis TaxID=82378 RepID=UPI003B21E6E1
MADAVEIERVLVTGATGYVAGHIIQQLQQAGYKVRGSVRSLSDENKIKHIKQLCPDAAHEVELVEADLQNADSWKSAVADCKYVVHSASPFPFLIPKKAEVVVNPAVEGVRNVLQAAVDSKTVKRVVMTSAGLAVCGSLDNGEFSEKDWPENMDSLDPYPRSKALAEKAAWDFVKELKDEDKIELAVINPTGVVGPVLNSTCGTSAEISKRLLERNPAMVIKVNLPMIDVRDVAEAHVKALTLPEAAGNRHLLCAGNMWWAEMADILSKEFKPQGYNVPSMMAPKFGLKLYSYFNRDTKAALSNWNKVAKFDSTRMKDVLKIEPRDLKESIIEMAYSVIEAGFVKKSKKYRGPGGDAPEGQEAEAAATNGDVDASGEGANGPTEKAAEGETKTEVTEETPNEETPKAEETPKEESPKESNDETPKESKEEETPNAKEETPNAKEEETPNAKEEETKEEEPKPTENGPSTQEEAAGEKEAENANKEEEPVKSDKTETPTTNGDAPSQEAEA